MSIYTDPTMRFCLVDGVGLILFDSPFEDTVELRPSLDTENLRNIRLTNRRASLKFGSHPLTIDYPQISGHCRPYIERRINTELRFQFLGDHQKTLQSWNAGKKMDDIDYITEVDVTFKVCLVSEHLISIQKTVGEVYVGYGIQESFDAINIEVESGYRLKFEDFFKPESDFLARFQDFSGAYSGQYRAAGRGSDMKTFDVLLYDDQFGVINVLHSLEFGLEYADVIDIIHPDSPLGRQLKLS